GLMSCVFLVCAGQPRPGAFRSAPVLPLRLRLLVRRELPKQCTQIMSNKQQQNPTTAASDASSEKSGVNLPKAYDPSAIEQRWADYWVNERLWDVPTLATPPAKDEAPFTMLLPPPNVTGRLHMGHMLNQTEMDILTRWHRMRGETALWVPGTDHAGIATQMMVERQLATEGKKRRELGREKFIERVWEWKK